MQRGAEHRVRQVFCIYRIILATTITIVCLDFFWGNRIIFRHYFRTEKEQRYLFAHGEYFVMMLILSAVTYLIYPWLTVDDFFVTMAIRMVVCVIVPNVIWAV